MNKKSRALNMIVEQAKTPAWSVSQVLAATGGRLSHGPSAAPGFCAVSTDSRSIGPGELFVALAGASHDGHAFLDRAVANGAAGLVVSSSRELGSLPAIPVIAVPDTLKALGDLAAFRRRQMRGLKVIAITGSCGKTTVKEMTAAIVSRKYRLIKTKGNFNNLIGLPHSLLPVNNAHEVAVLEMGMNEPGEIARLAAIADPDISCIVNVHQAHLAGLDDIRGVAEAKNELFAGTGPRGQLVVNLDDPLVRSLARRHQHKKTSFAVTPAGRRRGARLRATHIRSLGEDGMLFTLQADGAAQRVRINCLGLHSVANSLAAAAITYCLGMGLDEIASGLGAFQPCAQRLAIERLPSGLNLLNDTYNANPGSMTAALNTLHDLQRGRRAMAALGDMLELGPAGPEAHRQIGRIVARLGIDYLAAVGDFAADMVRAARQEGLPAARAMVFKTNADLAAWIRELQTAGRLAAGDWLLIKGSRGMRMEKVLAALTGPEQKEIN